MAHHLISQPLASRRLALSFLALALVIVAAAACGSNGGNGGPPGGGTVRIQVAVAGAGSVEAPELDFSCRGSCTLRVEKGERIELRAVPDPGQFAVAWDGPCGALAERCEWVANENVPVGMAFAPNVLRLELAGDDEGRFEIADGTDTTICRGSCGIGIAQPRSTAITYFPEATRTTVGPWTGDCEGQTPNYCRLTVAGIRTTGTTWLHPPLARDEDYTTDQETRLDVAVGEGLLANASDTPGDVLRAALPANSAARHGTLEVEADGSFRYQPDADFSGVDSFAYRVIDEIGNHADAVARITVRPRLVVQKGGAGSGTVTSEPAGIDCGPACQSDHLHVDDGEEVVLRAVAGTGSVFAGWGGACSGRDATCAVVVEANAQSTASVAAAFERARHTLTVQATGPGFGAVSSSPPGIDLGAEQTSHGFDYGTEITLSATPGLGKTFERWDGACTHSNPVCTFTITEDTTVSATFGIAVHTLSVASTGPGSGNVVSDPPGIIDLGVGVGSKQVEFGTEISLEATAGHGSVFQGWGGACSSFGTDPVCELTVTADTYVSAAFGLRTYALQSTIEGTGFGRVTSSPAGIIHTTDDPQASSQFAYGTPVSLTASTILGTNSTFVRWGKDCSSYGSDPLCVVTITKDTEVSAQFGLVPRTLSVVPTGTAGGNVTSYPIGIDLDDDRDSFAFDHGVTVELTVTERTGWEFGGWGGACEGAALTCAVEMTADRSVTVAFKRLRFTLESIIEGDGSGRVRSSPGTINHTTGSDSDEFDFGTEVTLTASPEDGSTFVGWGGDCARREQNRECRLIIDGDMTVTATFKPAVVTPDP
jgi:hypothetical protein